MKFVLFVCLFAVLAVCDVPEISCYFTASIRSSVRYSDGTIVNAAYEHYSIAKHAYMQSGLIADWFPRNMTSIFINPYNFTYIQPFFQRKVCAKVPFKSIVPCFVIDDTAVKKAESVRCPTDISSFCDVYESDYETWYLKSGSKPAIPDQLTVRDTSLGVTAVSSFLSFDPHRPDESKFVVPADQPCSDLVNGPFPTSESVDQEIRQRPIDMVDPFKMLTMRFRGKEFARSAIEKASRSHKTPRSIPVVQPLQKPWTRGEPLPDEFDATTQWPSCGIDHIMKQGQCASSWAISAAQTVADRYCIASKKQIELSPQYLIDCSTNQLGCRAGFADQAFMDLLRFGIVTESCWPYRANASTCPLKCADGSFPKMYRTRNYGSPYKSFDIAKTEEEIQIALISAGPVTTEMWLFGDFSGYQGGVYEHNSTTGVVYEHTMKIVGWGVDKDTGKKYWKVANTYGDDWGEKGYIRILRGVDECGLESMVAFGNPANDN